MRNTFAFILFLLITASFILSCDQKDDIAFKYTPASIQFLNAEEEYNLAVTDTLMCKYQYSGPTFDSLFMVTYNDVIKINGKLKDSIPYVANHWGSDRIYLVAHHSKDSIVISNTIRVNIISKRYPEIYLSHECLNEKGSYYLGDKFRLEFKPGLLNESFEPFINSHLYINEQLVASKKANPYSFDTEPLLSSENNIKFVLIDTARREYEYEFELPLIENPKPKIKAGFNYRHGLRDNYYMSFEPVTINASGSDDFQVDSIAYYFDDKLIETREIRDDYFYDEKIELGKLPSGKYSYYCMAYDNRGESKQSEVRELTVYKDYFVEDIVIDITKSNTNNHMFAITSDSLINIYIEDETITRKVLPFKNASSLFFNKTLDLLYIGFSTGELVAYDHKNESFATILKGELIEIQDFVMDGSIVIAICDSKVTMIDLNTRSITESNFNTDKQSKITIDPVNKFVYAGGDPHTTRGSVSKIAYNQNTLNQVVSNRIGGFCRKLVLKPNDNKLMVICKNNRGFIEYDTNTLRESSKYELITYNSSGNYDSSGNLFYTGLNTDNELFIYDSKNKSLQRDIYLPLSVPSINHIEASADGSNLIITSEGFISHGHLIFVPLGGDF